jgi:chloramphenicol 3-O-phosphotransferase
VREDAKAVLIAGAYLTGKSSVAAEIADVLEDRGVHYALLDLDYLGWAGAPGYDGHGDDPWLFLANLRAVTDNYVSAGIRHFVAAGHISDRRRLDSVVRVLDMPTRVVRLEVPLDEIARRAGTDPTSGRADDFRHAQTQVVSQPKDLEAIAVRNDRPIRETALEILALVDW